jgi:hypothetical protein
VGLRRSKLLSIRPVRVVTGATVFVVGILAGASIAMWVMPPGCGAALRRGPIPQLDRIMANAFSDRASATAALQAYQILIDRAANHQTIQYRELGERMHYGASDFLSAPLGKVMRWCARQGLPSLTALVITEEATLPSQAESSSERNHVFVFDWDSVFPPTLDELAP